MKKSVLTCLEKQYTPHLISCHFGRLQNSLKFAQMRKKKNDKHILNEIFKIIKS